MSEDLADLELTKNAINALKDAIYDLDGIILEKKDENARTENNFNELKSVSENMIAQIDLMINKLDKIAGKDGSGNN